MKKILSLILISLFIPILSFAQGQATEVRSVTVLPATCNPGGGSGGAPADHVDLLVGTQNIPYVCVSTNVWAPISTGNSNQGNLVISPALLNFGSVQDGTPSTLPVLVTNTGSSADTIISALITGANVADFGQTNSCGAISAGGSCVISVTFTPTLTSSEVASMTITSSGQNPIIIIPLSGLGTSATNFTLTLSPGIGANGTGTVVSTDNPPTINCNFTPSGTSGVCQNSYPNGTVVSLVASPAPGNVFSNFTGGDTPPNQCGVSPCNVTINSGLSPVLVNFFPNSATFILNVSLLGNGTGTIIGNNSASQINCTTGGIGQCSQRIAAGAMVTLTETPGTNSNFSLWGGVFGCLSGVTCSFSMSSDLLVSATFTGSSGSPPALIDTISKGTPGTNNISSVWSAPQSAGDLLIVAGQWYDNTVTVTSVTDTTGNTYTQLGSSPKVVGSLTAVLYYAKNIAAAAPGANITTIALSGNGVSRVMHGEHWSGVTTNPLDVSAGASGTSSSPNSGSVTPTAGDMMAAFNALTVSITAPSTGWTQNILNNYTSGMGFVQKRSSAPFTTTTGSVTFTSATTSGNTVVGGAISVSTSDTLSSVVTSTGQTCTITSDSPETETGAGSVWEFYCLNITGSAYPWYVNLNFASGSSKRGGWIKELSNGGRIPTFDTAAVGNGTTGTTINTPTITPTGSGDYYDCLVNAQNGISTVNSPWTAGSSGANTDYDEYQLSATGAQTAAYTGISSGSWATACLTLNPGSTGGDDFENILNATHTSQANTVTPSGSGSWVSYITGWLPQTTTQATNSLTILGSGNGSGTVTGSFNAQNCPISNGVAGTGCTVTSTSPITTTLLATPLTGNSFVRWTNGCNNPCQLSNLTGQFVITAVFNSTTSGPFSLTNQQPLSPISYSNNPASILGLKINRTKALAHPFGGTVGTSNAFGLCLVTNCGLTNGDSGIGNPTANNFWGFTTWASYGAYNPKAFYWSQATDPYYSISAANCANCFPGYFVEFHAPNNFLLPGANNTGWGGDQDVKIWDQSLGKVIEMYTSCGASIGFCYSPQTAGPCPSTQHQGAFADPCPLTNFSYAADVSDFYNVRDWGSTSPQGLGNVASDINFAPCAGCVRVGEVTSGAILHAYPISTNCINAPGGVLQYVFPDNRLGGLGPLKCTTGQNSNRPYEGQFFFLDYTDAQLNCLDPAQAGCTYSDTTPIPKVQAFQMIFLTQGAHYGWYVGETEGGEYPACGLCTTNGISLTPSANIAMDDPGTNYHYCGAPCGGDLGSPIWNWGAGIQAVSPNYIFIGTNRGTQNPSAETIAPRIYSNIPNMVGLSGAVDDNGANCVTGNSNHGCDFAGHVQSIDSCYVLTAAGQPGGC